MAGSEVSGEGPDVQDIFRRYVRERTYWQLVAEAAARELSSLAQHAKVRAKIDARAKTLGSVVGKLYRKEDAYRELRDFPDLAGARAIVPFVSDVAPLAAAISLHPSFVVRKDGIKVPKVSELTYQARHLDVELIDDCVPPGWPSDLEARPVMCEIQIQTFAQNLWANTSHLVTYKRSLPAEVERRITRLIALCEIFDSETASARDLALRSTDVIGLVAEDLVRYFYALTGVAHEADTTVAVVGALIGAIGLDELEGYRNAVEVFVEQQAVRLTSLLTNDPESHGIPLLVRPEVIFILERLQNGSMRLERIWSESFASRDLEELARAWGP